MEILDDIFVEEKMAVQKLLNGANATIAMDGWSTITNEPVIGVSIMSYQKPPLYSVFTCKAVHGSSAQILLVDRKKARIP